MDRITLSVLLFVTLSAPALAQTTVNGSRRIRGRWDASTATATLPVRKGLSAPTGTCTEGEIYFRTDAPPGGNLYFCTAPNVWTQSASASSGPFKAGYSGTSTSSMFHVALQTITIPANTLAVGDTIRITASYAHAGGVTTDWRAKVLFGGQSFEEVYGYSTDSGRQFEALIYITGASAQRATGRWVRPNSSVDTPTYTTWNVNTNASIDLVFQGRMIGATTETVMLENYVVEILKAN